jgi:aryl-alcohol dehydrogenase-like predicted oxidoreductase
MESACRRLALRQVQPDAPEAHGFATHQLRLPIVDKETWKILDVLAPIAQAHRCSPARLSIAWLLAKPVVTSVIIGAKRLEQLQDNLAADELTLTQDELRQLDEVSALRPEYPGWVLPFQEAAPVDRLQRLREMSTPH